MPSFLENYTTIRQALFKKSYFLLYLNKATGYVPLEYNDEVKCLVAALHMSGLGGKGDELNHFLHITNALANGFDPKNLPKLYKDEIEKASDDKKFSIFEKCQNTLHQDTIFDLLYPKVNNTPENNYSAASDINNFGTVILSSEGNNTPRDNCSTTSGTDNSNTIIAPETLKILMDSYSGNPVMTSFLERYNIPENERLVLSDYEKSAILDILCENNGLHEETILYLLYPKVNNTPENNYSATGNPDAGNLAAASYDIESSGDTSDNWDWLTH